MKGNTHMDHRKARKIYWLFLLAGSIVIVLTAFATDEILQKIIIGAGVGVWIIGFIVAFCFIRCPSVSYTHLNIKYHPSDSVRSF